MYKFKKFINSINLANIKLGTILRLIMVLISAVIYVLKVFNVATIESVDENLIANIVVAVLGVISFLQAYWKNNSWTDSAQLADEYMSSLKEVE